MQLAGRFNENQSQPRKGKWWSQKPRMGRIAPRFYYGKSAPARDRLHRLQNAWPQYDASGPSMQPILHPLWPWPQVRAWAWP